MSRIAASLLQVQTTVATREDGEHLGRCLVDDRLAACVQVVGPIRSTYRTQGRVSSNEEWLCLAKIRSDRFAEVAEAIRAVHAYQTPQIIAVPIADATADYLAWALAETTD